MDKFKPTFMRLLWLPFCLFATQILAQSDDRLVAYYSFDDNTADAVTTDSTLTINGQPRDFQLDFDCGAAGEALLLDGSMGRVDFAGQIGDFFKIADFSISLYFKANSPNGLQHILSRYNGECPDESAIAIRYNASLGTVEALLSEHENKNILLEGEIDTDACWQHVTIVRNTNRFFLYLNAELVDEGFTQSTIDLRGAPTVSIPLSLGGSPCPNIAEFPFDGLVDELRIYSTALSRAEIEDIYQAPDKITTPDALLVLGESLQINTSFSCVSSFQWSPADDIADVNNPNTTITPTEAGQHIYTLEFEDGNCQAIDRITINAVNPDELDCNLIFLPNVFTPNDDGLNDTFGISNPFVVEEITSFEVFDRWGSRVFQTTDATGTWDGTFKGSAVNPGMLLYRVEYKCNGTDFVKTGSVKVFR